MIIKDWRGFKHLSFVVVYVRENDYSEMYHIQLQWQEVPVIILKFDTFDEAHEEFVSLNEQWLLWQDNN